jgi:DNA-binding transcriptional MerR regulator
MVTTAYVRLVLAILALREDGFAYAEIDELLDLPVTRTGRPLSSYRIMNGRRARMVLASI